MNQPKISVIIPTRERCDVLEKSLKTVTSQTYDNLEIIVSDNYSNDGTEDVVRRNKDKRIKYINTGKRLSMSHNWEFALSYVTEGWVTIIGDDDGILPGALEKVAAVIKSTNIQAIRTRVCSYLWPSLSSTGVGQLSIPLKYGFEIRNSKKWLGKVLRGYTSYPELPMLYNGGYVDTAVINKIKAITGCFFKSYNPDIYSAVAISSVLEKYVYVYEPLAINGASSHSTGTSSFSGKKEKKGSPNQKFLSEGNIPSHQDVPLCEDGTYPRSLQAMFYESYLQSDSLRKSEKKMHAEQLLTILATSGRHKTAVEKWGEIFARIHHLKYDQMKSRALWKKNVLSIAASQERIERMLNTYMVGSPDCPVLDVFHATIVAGEILNDKPSRVVLNRQLIKRLYDRIVNHSILSASNA